MNILDTLKNLYTLFISTSGKSNITIVITITAVIIGLGSVYFLKANNPVEIAAEEVIKSIDGVQIDLTPGG
jgi:hypothetical protein